jgi:group I intron endonuclease
VGLASSETAIVYQARNLVNGHRYIGFTTQGLPKRKEQHFKSARVKQPRFRFQHAIAKYGPENFVFEVIADFDGDEELAKLYEYEAIAAYKPEYNLSYGGDGGRLSDETKAKLSAKATGRIGTHLGKKFSDETRRRMSEAMKGKPHLGARGKKRDPDVVERIRQATLGHPNYNTKPMSDETRAKISAGHKGRVPWIKGLKHSEETKQRMRAARQQFYASRTPDQTNVLNENRLRARRARQTPVICLNDGRVFHGYADAAKFYGVSRPSVAHVVQGRWASVKGFMFAKYEAPN